MMNIADRAAGRMNLRHGDRVYLSGESTAARLTRRAGVGGFAWHS